MSVDLNGNRNSKEHILVDVASKNRMDNLELSESEHQLSTLADQLGIHEIDALSSSISNISVTSRRRRDQPTVILTQEQVETLILTLDETGDALKQLLYRGQDLGPRKRSRIPPWIISNLLMITTAWQILGIVALTLLDLFTQHKKKEKATFIMTVTILVLFQSFNLILVFITSVKLTKQFMHHTVTKSFLGQSFLSMTLLFAGLYTLVYNIEYSSFQGTKVPELKISDDLFAATLIFANMLYFSISTATLCGAGHIIASTWYAQLLSSVQMLMSYVYFASVLSLAVHPPKNINFKLKRRSLNKYKSYGAVQSV